MSTVKHHFMLTNDETETSHNISYKGKLCSNFEFEKKIVLKSNCGNYYTGKKKKSLVYIFTVDKFYNMKITTQYDCKNVWSQVR